MESPQAAQAVLGEPGPTRFVLELVQPLPEPAGRQAWGWAGVGLTWMAGLLGLAGTLPPPYRWALGALALLGYLLWQLFSRHDPKPAAANRRLLGRLLVLADRLVLEADGTSRTYPLDARTRLTIRYQGYRDEALAPRLRASGLANYLQLDDGPTYAFDVPHAARESVLREELRKWYHRRVQLKEYRQGNRTFLLTRDLSDEQVRQYQQEFGVKLYR